MRLASDPPSAPARQPLPALVPRERFGEQACPHCKVSATARPLIGGGAQSVHFKPTHTRTGGRGCRHWRYATVPPNFCYPLLRQSWLVWGHSRFRFGG